MQACSPPGTKAGRLQGATTQSSRILANGGGCLTPPNLSLPETPGPGLSKGDSEREEASVRGLQETD